MRRHGTVLVACSLVAGLALVRRVPGAGGLSSVYPWWTAVLVHVELAVAVLVLRSQRPAVLQAAAVAGAVVALQLAGTGVVARKHVRPALGTGGITGDVVPLEHAALVLAVAGVVALGTCLTLLRACAGPAHRRAGALALGLAVAVLVPLAVALTDREMRDVTSLGAVALAYALPWGAGLAATGWLARPAALAAVGTVAGSALLALLGPQLPDLVTGDPRPAFAGALVVALVVLAREQRVAAGAPPAG